MKLEHKLTMWNRKENDCTEEYIPEFSESYIYFHRRQDAIVYTLIYDKS